MDKLYRESILLLSSEKRTFLNRNYYGARDVFLIVLECPKDKVMKLKIISILSNQTIYSAYISAIEFI